MIKGSTLLGIALVVALGVGQVSVAAAAPLSDPLAGDITDIQLQGDGTSLTDTILVTYKDDTGAYHTVSLGLTEASELLLITLDPDGTWGGWGLLGVVGAPIALNLATFEVIDPCTSAGHPVVGALCGVFFPYLGASADMIAEWHADGYGFGVIAQALFMAQKLEGDMAMADLILEAKTTRDFSGFGEDFADISNWGQFKKAVMAGEDKSKSNLGAVMSGRVEPPTLTTQTTLSTATNGNGRGHGEKHGKGGNHGKGKGKGH